MAIIEDLLAYFGVCKIGLVLQIEYHRNIQTLISKLDFSMWQHNLETHHSITRWPLFYQLKKLAQRKLCVEGNGPVKGTTMDFLNFLIKQSYGDNYIRGIL